MFRSPICCDPDIHVQRARRPSAAPIGTLGDIDLPMGENGAICLVSARCYAIPLRTRFRGITVREGMVIEGPAGWGEFCPFPEYCDAEAAAWLATVVEQATVSRPAPVRDSVPVNAIVPAVGPDEAHAAVVRSGCRTAKVKVA